MLEVVLVLDTNAVPFVHEGRTRPGDRDEVQEFCRSVCMTYRVRPLAHFAKPDDALWTACVTFGGPCRRVRLHALRRVPPFPFPNRTGIADPGQKPAPKAPCLHDMERMGGRTT